LEHLLFWQSLELYIVSCDSINSSSPFSAVRSLSLRFQQSLEFYTEIFVPVNVFKNFLCFHRPGHLALSRVLVLRRFQQSLRL